MRPPIKPRSRRKMVSAREAMKNREASSKENEQTPKDVAVPSHSELKPAVSTKAPEKKIPKRPTRSGVKKVLGRQSRNPMSSVEPSYDEVFSEDQRDAYKKYVEPALNKLEEGRFALDNGIANYGTTYASILPSKKAPVVDKLPEQIGSVSYSALTDDAFKKFVNEFASNRLAVEDTKVIFDGKEYEIYSAEFSDHMENALELMKHNNYQDRRVMKNIAANELVSRGVDVQNPEDIIIGVPLIHNGNEVVLPVYEDRFPERDDGPSM